ncbi:metallophosphoesterase [Peribacillus sp. SCS-155]|uniref:metallophosphoesterase n=1 Tax=Peribacillus sedimenti TaxID=3115297 RepID=UPI003906B98F
MNKKMNRRSFLKKALGSLFTVTGAGLGGKYYINKIEPGWLEINHLSFSSKAVPKGFDGVKIVQFSDTHLGFQFQLQDLKEIIHVINSLDPDLIMFTGDLMDKPDQYTGYDEIIPVMKECKARLGKFCIFGNHDHGGYGSELYSRIMSKSGFILLRNSNRKIQLLGGDEIYISGLDEPMLGSPDIDKALQGIPRNHLAVMLSHAPDTAVTTSKYDVQLQLSGHSHGGQVQIPFFGALVTPPYSEIYREGTYDVGELKLHVNRGLGTTRLPYRFLSRPELTVIRLQSES